MNIPSRYQIVEEKQVEINLRPDLVIRRLQEMSGSCRNLDAHQSALYFDCSSKGRFSVSTYGPNHRSSFLHFELFSIYGEVTESTIHPGKATLYYALLRENPSLLFIERAVVFLIPLIGLVIMAFAFAWAKAIRPIGIFTAVAVSAACLLIFLQLRKRPKGDAYDVRILREEMEDRIDAVIKWEQ